jgi:hypothetical protein
MSFGYMLAQANLDGNESLLTSAAFERPAALTTPFELFTQPVSPLPNPQQQQHISRPEVTKVTPETLGVMEMNPGPKIKAAKTERITIWREEVTRLTFYCDCQPTSSKFKTSSIIKSPFSRSAPEEAPSAASDSGSLTGQTAVPCTTCTVIKTPWVSDPHPVATSPVRNKPLRVWDGAKRLARKCSGKDGPADEYPLSPPASNPSTRSKSGEDCSKGGVVKTDMYRRLRGERLGNWKGYDKEAGTGDGNGKAGDEESEDEDLVGGWRDSGDSGVRRRQTEVRDARLERAERLLERLRQGNTGKA